MAITDEDRRKLTDLALRVLDRVEEYGEDAVLVGASIVFEVRTPDPDDPEDFHTHGNYNSFSGMSPIHVGGLFRTMSAWLLDKFEES